MIYFLRILLLCFFMAVMTGCNAGFAKLDRTYLQRTSYSEHELFNKLRQQIKTSKSCSDYRSSQLYFFPYDTHASNGLYFAVMPVKKSHQVVLIPCLISPDTSFLNTVYFAGKAVSDTARLKASVNRALQSLSNDDASWTRTSFSQAQLDSIQKTFLYGSFRRVKAGYNFRHPVY